MRYKWISIGVTLVLAAFSMTVLCRSHAGAESDPPSAWRMVGQIGGPTQAVAAQGHYAYVGVGLRLVVLDVSNPASPVEVGSTTPFPYFVEDVVVSGTLAYVAAGGAGLRVVDVSDPTDPAELGAWDSPGYAEGIAVSGTVAYLADGPYGLCAVDVSDPSHPLPLGTAYDMNYAFDVTVAGRYAYVAAAGAGLLVVDVAHPEHLLEVGTLDTSGYAQGVAVSGALAYVADEWEGLQVVDVSEPADPLLVSSLHTAGWAFGVVVSGGRAYVADAFAGLRVLDVTDPEHPAELGAYSVAGGHAGSVAIAGDLAFVADRNWGLRVVSLADVHHPYQVGAFRPLNYARGVVVAGEHAYVAAANDGLAVVDISNPGHSVLVGSFDAHDYAIAVAAGGGYIYLSTFSTGGLHVMDVADAAHPSRVGYIDRGGCDLAVAGATAYLSNEAGLELVSVSDPSRPTLLGSILLLEYVGAPDAAVGVTVSGTLAYVASGRAGLEVVDVSNPLSPTLIGAYSSGVSAFQDVVIAGNVAYVADGSGLRTVDVSSPTHPTGMGFYDTPGEAYGVVVSASVAYVACGSEGVAVANVSNPYSPTLLSSLDTLGYAHQVAVAGNHIYVADGFNGLLILESAGGSSTDEGRAPPDQSRALPAQQVILEQGMSPRTALLPGESVTQPAALVTSRRTPLTAGKPRTSKPRQAAAIATGCTVTSTADSGPGSLRGCLERAGSGGTITFDPAVFAPSDPVSISVYSPLPPLDQGNVTVDASNAGAILEGSGTPNTTGLVIMSDGNTIRGLQVLNFSGDGVLVFNGAKNNRIGGDRFRGSGPLGEGNLISGNGQSGIELSGIGTMSNTVVGNWIGTDPSGMLIDGNQAGVSILYGASYNTVGGAAAGLRNVIAGNQTDVEIAFAGSEHNVVLGNRIGTDLSGSLRLRDSLPPGCYPRGVAIESGARQNIIGPGNVVNGSYWGIQLFGEGVDENIIVGNLIGTNASGEAAIGNFSDGILISEGPQRNRIGGATPGERNIISGNGGNGISINGAQTVSNTVIGNYVGTDASGTAALGNMGPGGGIQVWSPGNFIGGYLPGEGNLVSSNGSNGISLIGDLAYGNRIIGNCSGTDVSGAVDLGNRGFGIGIEGFAFNNLVQGNLSSGNNRAGVGISDPGSNYNVVVGNRIGTDASGMRAIPNDEHGVFVGWGGSCFNRIGGTGEGEGNLVSGNSDSGGIVVYGAGATSNLILGNQIGTDISGEKRLPNSSGVGIAGGAIHTIVGGATAGERNTISGNGKSGVELSSDHNFVVGNVIGADVGGGAALGNAWVAVNVQDAEHNVIQGNLIAYSGSHGFWVHLAAFNTIRRNSIHDNAEQAILLSDGGNDMLPAPVILTAVSLDGVSGTGCPDCMVEVFSDDEDEGRIYEGTAVADAAGRFTFTKASGLTGPFITATATDGEGNTSAFSSPRAVGHNVYLPAILRVW